MMSWNDNLQMPEELNVPYCAYMKYCVNTYLFSIEKEEREDIIKCLQAIKTDEEVFGNYYTKIQSMHDDIWDEEFIIKQFRERGKNISCAEEAGKIYVDNIMKYGVDTFYDWRYKYTGKVY